MYVISPPRASRKIANQDRIQVSDGKAAYKVRAAALAAGFPNTAGASSVNRFCSSGLKATADIANSITNDVISIGIAMGAENMSVGGDKLEQPFDEAVTSASQEAEDCMQPMGWTSENVSKDFGVSRDLMDAFAAESFQKAEAAKNAGWFADEIVPIKTKIQGPDGEWKEVTLTEDDGIRPGTTKEGLSKIRSAFPQWGGSTTGGNASQVTDGGKCFPWTLFNHCECTQADSSNSRRRSLDEAIHRHQARPTHRGQVRRLDRCRSGPAHHGHRPYRRHPQAPDDLQHLPGRHRRRRDQRGFCLHGRLLPQQARPDVAEDEPSRRRHCPGTPAGRDRCATDRDGTERVEADEEEDSADKHVHWNGPGNGGTVR